MEEGDTEADKSEQATPFKLRRARERGAVARSMDLGFFAALAAALGFLWTGGQKLAQALAIGTRQAMAAAGSPGGEVTGFAALTWQIAAPAGWLLLVFVASLFMLALVLEFLQVGPVFSMTPLKPDFGRINPAKGLKRLLSWRMLVEALKACLKLAVYATIGWLVLSDALADWTAAALDARRMAGLMLSVTVKLIAFYALAAFGFAIFDQILVRREFGKKMRMSRRELKREHRDREGDPRFKQKRRQFHNEFAKAVKALRAVRGSDVVITNPTHFAMALKYDPAAMAAPVIVARGTGEMAHRIKRIAFTYGVLTVEEPKLARALFRSARLDQEIPAQFFQTIADLYLRYRIGQNPARAAINALES